MNQVEGGSRATKVCDRYSYDPEKLAALETWARKLTVTLESNESKDAGKVLSFRRT